MGRCKNETLLRKINIPKLTKEHSEVSFTILHDLDNCRRINTKDQLLEDKGTYNKYLVPKNQFECLGEGCVNTGTFIMDAAASPAQVKFYAKFDMTEVANGAITFYVYDLNKAAHSLTVLIGEAEALTNADSYAVSVAAGDYDEEGFAPVIIDLTATPTDVGNGWTPNQTGAYISIAPDAAAAIGISSISLFESMEDFATIDVVKVGCLSSVGGTLDPSLIESACNKAKYNDQMGGLSFNVTGRNATPNYWKLNPMAGKGKAAKGFIIATVEKTIGQDNTVTLADLYQDECRFISVQLKNACDAWETELTQIFAPVGMTNLAPDHYQVIKQADGSTKLKFAAGLAGQDILVSYPREADVDETVVNTDFLNSTHVSMAVPVCEEGRVMRMLVFNNVYITSFPYSLSENDTDFSFSINIQPDRGGDYFHNYKILS